MVWAHEIYEQTVLRTPNQTIGLPWAHDHASAYITNKTGWQQGGTERTPGSGPGGTPSSHHIKWESEFEGPNGVIVGMVMYTSHRFGSTVEKHNSQGGTK
ncbi:MAG: hypothetical protein ACI8PZ_004132 [Myxococcota bacterium]|jgi:hypothetical protein